MEATPQSMPAGVVETEPDAEAETAIETEAGTGTAHEPESGCVPVAAEADAGVHAELATLRAAVLALEAELAETHRRANQAIAAAQERAYWLDRWHVDLNDLMHRRWAIGLRAVLRAVRALLRRLRRFTRSLR